MLMFAEDDAIDGKFHRNGEAEPSFADRAEPPLSPGLG